MKKLDVSKKRLKKIIYYSTVWRKKELHIITNSAPMAARAVFQVLAGGGAPSDERGGGAPSNESNYSAWPPAHMLTLYRVFLLPRSVPVRFIIIGLLYCEIHVSIGAVEMMLCL